MRLGILFPGQGTQHIGMGKSWYESDRIVQQYFEQASSCLSLNLAKLCFSSHADELKKTRHAQISIFVVSCALYHVLKKKAGIKPALMAGHSSGEYAALRSAGAFTFADALYLLDRRAQLMEEATNVSPGSMLAVLGLSDREVRAICAACDRPRSRKWVAQVAVYNGPSQTVISCTQNYVPQLQRAITVAGGRSRLLPVGGGFHSRMMTEAQDRLSQSMAKVRILPPHTPLVSNITAQQITNEQEVIDELTQQMCAPVNWWQSMRQFVDCDLIIQVGPGKTFAKLLQRHWPEKKVLGFTSTQDLDPVINAVATIQSQKV